MELVPLPLRTASGTSIRNKLTEQPVVYFVGTLMPDAGDSFWCRQLLEGCRLKMPTIPASAAHPVLFLPWQPDAAPELTATQQSEYIELPPIRDFGELSDSGSYVSIRAQFLEDVRKLQKLAYHYVGDQYKRQIEVFYNKLRCPTDDLVDHILPLYCETRFQIHQLVHQLNACLSASVEQKEYIASLLHDCLNGIDHCPAGVHSRFASSFLDLKATQAGLDGKLYKIRSDLFHRFVTSFLFQQQREGKLSICEGMEIHWFNALHNLYCDSVSLQPIVDPRAPTNIDARVIRQFLSSAKLSVTAHTILCEMSAQWSDQLSIILHQQGVREWETELIDPACFTADITQTLHNQLFRPVNHLLKAPPSQALGLNTIAEEDGEGYYRLNRHREKLLAWVTSHFYGPSATVFAVIYSDSRSCTCIGTNNQLFFWVFDHSPGLSANQACTFEADNHTTLTLGHLANVDFSTWPKQTSHALLTQAMAQTDCPEEIADFFQGSASGAQLRKIPRPVKQALAHQVSEKLARNPVTFKETLSRSICQAVFRSSPRPDLSTLYWLLETPLLESVLLGLQRRQGNIVSLTKVLNSWQISSFCRQSLSTLLTVKDCRRLFHQAYTLNQGQTVLNFLLTGRCDSLAFTPGSGGRADYLCFFARNGILSGIQYLLRLPFTDVNSKDSSGWMPLATAARFGNVQCLEALLAVDGIQVNAKTNRGSNALTAAAAAGHVACVRVLLSRSDVEVNAVNVKGDTALNLAAVYGHAECVEVLLRAKGIRVNANTGFQRQTPLYSAVKGGHLNCVRLLLNANGIKVNRRNAYHSTPLHVAASKGHDNCIAALLGARGINVNAVEIAGHTPLHCAALHDRPACISVLLQAKDIRVNPKNNRFTTPLHLAAQKPSAECLRELVKARGIDINERNEHGWTPLHCAISLGHTDAVKALLCEPSLRVNKRTMFMLRTPLIVAMDFCRPECVLLLLEHERTRLNKLDLTLNTALSLARKYEMTQIASLLEADNRLSRPVDRVLKMIGR